jgi:hypothetical protein
MRIKVQLAGMAASAVLLTILAGGCVTASGYKNPDVETTKQRTLGTADELSPQAPGGACNVKKVGNQWTCELNGKTMVYNDAANRWEARQK